MPICGLQLADETESFLALCQHKISAPKLMRLAVMMPSADYRPLNTLHLDLIREGSVWHWPLLAN
jgi:hypothetical protein